MYEQIQRNLPWVAITIASSNLPLFLIVIVEEIDGTRSVKEFCFLVFQLFDIMDIRYNGAS